MKPFRHILMLLLFTAISMSNQAQTLQEMAKPASSRARKFRITDPKPDQRIRTHSKLWRYTLTDNQGQPYRLSQHKGKVVLIVNTASHCGYTKQYEGLEALHRKYASQGLVIIAIPCNQFGTQEPGTAEEIATFCSTTYGVSFPIMAKAEVNGDNALPLYHFLKHRAPEATGADIRWNFTKFLIERNGKSVTRYESNFTPEQLESTITAALAR